MTASLQCCWTTARPGSGGAVLVPPAEGASGVLRVVEEILRGTRSVPPADLAALPRAGDAAAAHQELYRRLLAQLPGV